MSAALRPPLSYRWPLAPLWLRPWFDWFGLRFLEHFFLPTSHAWALAAASEGDADRFRARLGVPLPAAADFSPLLQRVLERQRRYDQAAAAWEAGCFALPVSGTALARLEQDRSGAAHDFMAARRLFGPWRRRLPAAGWDIAPPAAVTEKHGPRLADPARAYAPPPDLAIARSPALPRATGGSLSWLRFTSPVLGDKVTARLLEPPAPAPGAPTLILLHGIAMEEEMWRPRYDPLEELLAAGWRVVKPEGPWHGRRRAPGRYGGEPIIARGLEGMLTCLQAWIAECALLIRWARETSGGGPVALGGISLGSLTAQLCASVARGWPAALAPDALFLIATSGSLQRAAFDGALAQALGLPARLAAAGWSEAELARWLPLLDPGESAVPPARTVLLLGAADRVTPFDAGCDLARRWQVPAENLFVRRQGYFSVSLGLAADRGPLERLRQVVA